MCVWMYKKKPKITKIPVDDLFSRPIARAAATCTCALACLFGIANMHNHLMQGFGQNCISNSITQFTWLPLAAVLFVTDGWIHTPSRHFFFFNVFLCFYGRTSFDSLAFSNFFTFPSLFRSHRFHRRSSIYGSSTIYARHCRSIMHSTSRHRQPTWQCSMPTVVYDGLVVISATYSHL